MMTINRSTGPEYVGKWTFTLGKEHLDTISVSLGDLAKEIIEYFISLIARLDEERGD